MFDKITYQILWDIATHHPEAGVSKIEYVHHFGRNLHEVGLIEDGESAPWFKDVVHDFREIPEAELPSGMKAGINLKTLAINPNIYLPYLQSQLLSLGTTFIRRRLSHIREALSLTNVVPSAIVNATGLLSLELGGVEDKNLYPTRGQTILVRNTCSKIYARSSVTNNGEGCYVIPRPFGGGTILGGSREQNNWNSEVDPNLAHRIALRCVNIAPELTGGEGVDKLDIIRHNVGLRPSRHGGVRVEAEHIKDVGLVIHNYGAGGAGYQSSWGTATKAMELLEEALGGQ